MNLRQQIHKASLTIDLLNDTAQNRADQIAQRLQNFDSHLTILHQRLAALQTAMAALEQKSEKQLTDLIAKVK